MPYRNVSPDTFDTLNLFCHDKRPDALRFIRIRHLVFLIGYFMLFRGRQGQANVNHSRHLHQYDSVRRSLPGKYHFRCPLIID